MASCNYPFDSAPEDWAPFGVMDLTMEGDISTPEEATAVRQFVQAYDTPLAIASEEAACRLISLDETRIPCDGLLDKGYRVSILLWDVVIAMPQYQTAVLVLVDAVRALPEGLGATPEQVTRFGEEKLQDWRFLSKWEEDWHEQYHLLSMLRYSGAQLNNENLFDGDWVLICALTARYLVLHPPDMVYTSELSRVFAQIRRALEYDAWNYATAEEKQMDLSRTHLSGGLYDWCNITTLNTDVISIVPYLRIAGPIIYRYTDRETISRRFAETGHDSHEHNTREFWVSLTTGSKPGGNPKRPTGRRVLPDAVHLWKGDVWLTRDRWEFWKQRLVWISGCDDPLLLQRTRDEARKLAQLMQQIEETVT